MKPRNRINTILFLALIGAFVLWTKSGNSMAEEANTNENTIWKSEIISVDVPAYVTASTSGGSISVVSHDDDEIRIDIYVRESNKYLRAGEDAPVEIKIDRTDSGVEISAETQRSRRLFSRSHSVSVSYRIYVPEVTEVRANTSGGHISAKDIRHNVSLITSGGSISASNITGDVLARTSGGPITIEDVVGELTARTSGGGIRVSNSEGIIQARTSGGSISFENVSGSIEGITSGGPISASITTLDDYLKLKTSGGSIKTTLPKMQGMDIHASGSSVSFDFDDFSGNTSRNSISGTVNGGGIPVEIKTSGGSVRIDTR